MSNQFFANQRIFIPDTLIQAAEINAQFNDVVAAFDGVENFANLLRIDVDAATLVANNARDAAQAALLAANDATDATAALAVRTTAAEGNITQLISDIQSAAVDIAAVDAKANANAAAIELVDDKADSIQIELDGLEALVAAQQQTNLDLINTKNEKVEVLQDGVQIATELKSLNVVGEGTNLTNVGGAVTLTVNNIPLEVRRDGIVLESDVRRINLFGDGVQVTQSVDGQVDFNIVGYIPPEAEQGGNFFAPSVIAKPSILSPANTSSAPTIVNGYFSEFEVTSGQDAHRSTQVQIATDPSFTSIVINTSITKGNLRFFEAEPNVLNLNTTYYMRIRFIGASNSSSPFSDTVQFVTEIRTKPNYLGGNLAGVYRSIYHDNEAYGIGFRQNVVYSNNLFADDNYTIGLCSPISSSNSGTASQNPISGIGFNPTIKALGFAQRAAVNIVSAGAVDIVTRSLGYVIDYLCYNTTIGLWVAAGASSLSYSSTGSNWTTVALGATANSMDFSDHYGEVYIGLTSGQVAILKRDANNDVQVTAQKVTTTETDTIIGFTRLQNGTYVWSRANSSQLVSASTLGGLTANTVTYNNPQTTNYRYKDLIAVGDSIFCWNYFSSVILLQRVSFSGATLVTENSVQTIQSSGVNSLQKTKHPARSGYQITGHGSPSSSAEDGFCFYESEMPTTRLALGLTYKAPPRNSTLVNAFQGSGAFQRIASNGLNYVIAATGGVYFSTDGRKWDLVHTYSVGTSSLNPIGVVNGRYFVTVNDSTTFAARTSVDGQNWITTNAPLVNPPVYHQASGTYWGVSRGAIFSSTDAINWVSRNLPQDVIDSGFSNLQVNINGDTISISNTSLIQTIVSFDAGANWTTSRSATAVYVPSTDRVYYFSRIGYHWTEAVDGHKVFNAKSFNFDGYPTWAQHNSTTGLTEVVTGTGWRYTTTDFNTWTTTHSGNYDVEHDRTYSPELNRYVKISRSNSALYYSSDAVNWTLATKPAAFLGRGVSWSAGQNLFVAAGQDERGSSGTYTEEMFDWSQDVQARRTVLYSRDGIKWFYPTFNHVEEANGVYVKVGDAGHICSGNQIDTVATRESNCTDDLTFVRWVPFLNRFYAVGRNGRVCYSSNGTTWTTLVLGGGVELKVVQANATTLFIWADAKVFTSTDGVNFVERVSPISKPVDAAVHPTTNRVVVVSRNHQVTSTLDGITFNTTTLNRTNATVNYSARNVSWVPKDSIFVIGSYWDTGHTYKSTDGITWSFFRFDTTAGALGNAGNDTFHSPVVWHEIDQKYLAIRTTNGWGNSSYSMSTGQEGQATVQSILNFGARGNDGARLCRLHSGRVAFISGAQELGLVDSTNLLSAHTNYFSNTYWYPQFWSKFDVGLETAADGGVTDLQSVNHPESIFSMLGQSSNTTASSRLAVTPDGVVIRVAASASSYSSLTVTQSSAANQFPLVRNSSSVSLRYGSTTSPSISSSTNDRFYTAVATSNGVVINHEAVVPIFTSSSVAPNRIGNAINHGSLTATRQNWAYESPVDLRNGKSALIAYSGANYSVFQKQAGNFDFAQLYPLDNGFLNLAYDGSYLTASLGSDFRAIDAPAGQAVYVSSQPAIAVDKFATNGSSLVALSQYGNLVSSSNL